MIGGKLGIQGAANADLAEELLAAGFNAVFTEGADPAEFSRVLAQFASIEIISNEGVAA